LKRLLSSAGALAMAWFVVVAAIAGAVALSVLQPPAPGGGDPVVIALAPAEAPAEQMADDTTPETPAAPEPEDPTADHAQPENVSLPAAPPSTPLQVEQPSEPSSESSSGATPEPALTEAEPAATERTEAEPAETDMPATVAATEQPAEGQEAPVSSPTPQPHVQEALNRIPVIPPAPEQLAPWERYRQPFNTDDKRPRIAVVLTGLGLSESATKAAIEQLPAAVTLSFSPYTRGLERWIALARARGHEVMLDLPMEPATFPNEDPGPQALLTSLTPRANLDRLDWVLSRGSAYVGLAGSMGSRFTATREAVEPVLREVQARGLLFLDRHTSEESLVPALAEEIGLRHAVNSRTIDERQASRVAIDARLAQVERVALTSGFAVAMAQPYPVSIERLAEWAGDLPARGFAVAPITALVDRQEAP
jgi:uncharacterized protein